MPSSVSSEQEQAYTNSHLSLSLPRVLIGNLVAEGGGHPLGDLSWPEAVANIQHASFNSVLTRLAVRRSAFRGLPLGRTSVAVRPLAVARVVPCVVGPQGRSTTRPMNALPAWWSEMLLGCSGWMDPRVFLNMGWFQPLCSRRSPWSKHFPWKSPLDPLFGRMGRGSFLPTRPSGSSLLSRSPLSGFGGPAASCQTAKGWSNLGAP